MIEKNKKFGEFFKEKRIALGLSLREFCERHDLDPANISRLETGKALPPKERKLKEYADYLGLKQKTEEWNTFFDLAAIVSKRLPADLTDKQLSEKLPLLFRTVRGKKLSKKELLRLIKLIKET